MFEPNSSDGTNQLLDPSCTNPRLQSELDFLFGRINYERKTDLVYPRHFKLDSMRRLLHELGNPHQEYQIVHVAGTKGKGSVSNMIASALHHSGYQTGVYSSPHLETIRERISINGRLISESDLAAVLSEIRQATQELDRLADNHNIRKNSFFEMITAAALKHFANQQVDRVVLEVGLGGRLDSTNVCQPVLCVITNISLDHTRQLGSSVDLIAREKAGIIKPGVPVISGSTDPLAQREIREAAAVNDSTLLELNRDFHYTVHPRQEFSDPDSESTIGQVFSTRGRLLRNLFDADEPLSYDLHELTLNAIGGHQVQNAAVAVAALQVLGLEDDKIQESAIRRALEEFTLIGRCELLSQKPLVLVDMAHNTASIKALSTLVKRLKSERRPTTSTLVFASSRDKDLTGMLTEIVPNFERVIFTRFIDNPRATDPSQLLTLAEEIANRSESETVSPVFEMADSPEKAWQQVDKDDTNSLVCVCGSAFLIAEIRPLIQRQFKLLAEGSR